MQDLLSGIFLLIIIVFSNSLGTTMDKNLLNLLDKYYAKYILLFIVIYFSVDFTNDDTVHPLLQLRHTVIIFVFYILITRNYVSVSVLLFALTLINYFINTEIKYRENNKDENKTISAELTKNSKMLTNFIVIASIITFLHRLLIKSSAKNFSLSNYLFK